MSPTAIAAGIILAIGLGGGGYTVWRWQEAKVLKAQIAAKESERIADQAALRAYRMQESLFASEDISRKRQKKLIQAQEDAKLFQSAFEALYAESKTAKDWGETPIPDSIRCLRRELDKGLPPDSSLQCPVKPTGPDGGTTPRRPDERPIIKGVPGRPERFTKM